MDDSNLIDEKWHPEAFGAGMEARQLGYVMNDSAANPYVSYGESHWMLKSFRAGWCDRDQALIAESDDYACLI